jgi:hypothetical protein
MEPNVVVYIFYFEFFNFQLLLYYSFWFTNLLLWSCQRMSLLRLSKGISKKRNHQMLKLLLENKWNQNPLAKLPNVKWRWMLLDYMNGKLW